MTVPPYEPRPRGKFIGERAGGRHVPEAEHFFRCVACGGHFDARDLAWIEDHEGPLPHPRRRISRNRLHGRSAQPRGARELDRRIVQRPLRRRLTTLR